MSNTIDQRVVEMRFDNRHFENNVSTTMSTLDKLKQKLNLSGASKGLSDINAASKKVDMSGLGGSVESISAKFSALQVIGVTALANITNSAVNAGKKIISALTIDPIKTGFNEYETKINAIQTIMSNTASKGTTMADVTRVIDELNTYADKTIYNFAEMTRNIGTFTAAGVGLEESASAIQGIANLAAASGSTSQQASTAMYQLSQALAAGTVKLMDWNSVVNAGMGGEKFQEALKATAREHGVAVDKMIEKNGSFRESLSEGWITAEILNETLSKFTEKGAKEYAQAMVDSGKWTDEQAEALIREARAMEDAATKVKTFTQLWDTLKESVQSGWGKTWELIIGNFEDARKTLTEISDLLTGPDSFLTKSANSRNAFLTNVLGSNWDKLIERLGEAGIEADQFDKALRSTLENSNYDVQKLIDKHGSLAEAFRSGSITTYMLEKAIKSLGNTTESADFSKLSLGTHLGDANEGVKQLQKALLDLGYDLGEFGADGKFGKETYQAVMMFQRAAGITIDGWVGEETLNALKDATKATETLTGDNEILVESYSDLINAIQERSGRELLLGSFKNSLESILKILGTVSEAFWETFSISPSAVQGFLQGLFDFTNNLIITDETAEKLKKTLKGVFAIFDLIGTIAGSGVKIAIKTVNAILAHFNLGILDVTAGVADAIVAFRDWVDSVIDIEGAVAVVVPWLKNAYGYIKSLVATAANTEVFKKFSAELSNLKTKIVDWFNGLKSGKVSVQDAVDSLMTTIRGAAQPVYDAALELGKKIIAGIRDALGIRSASAAEMTEAGEESVNGLLSGLQNGEFSLIEKFKNIGSRISEFIANIDWGSVFAGGLSIGMVAIIKKLADAMDTIASPIGGLGEVLQGVGTVLQKSARPIKRILNNVAKVVKSFSRTMNAISFNIKAKAIKDLAIALAILAAAIIAMALIPANQLWGAVGAMAVLSLIIIALALVTSKIANSSMELSREGMKVNNLGTIILGIAASLLIVAIAMKMLGGLGTYEFGQALGGILVITVVLGGLLGLCAFISKMEIDGIDKTAGALMKISGAMLILAVVAKIFGGMEWGEIGKAAVGLVGIGGIVTGLVALSKLAGKHIYKAGKALVQIAAAMLILTVVAKLIAGMSWGDMGKAAVGLIALGGIVTGLVATTKLAGDNLDKIGSTIAGIGAAFLLLAIAAKIIATMSWGDMGKAAVGLLGLTGIITLLVLSTKLIENDVPKMAATLLAMSVSIGILAAIAVVLSLIPLGGLAKGVVAVALLGATMTAMIWATRGASECAGNMYAMAVAIGVMAASVAVLSMIDIVKLAGAVVALSTLMLVFTLLIKVAGAAQGSIGTLIVMTVAIAVLGGVLYLLSDLPVQTALGVAAALSILMLTLSASLLIIGLARSPSVMALASIGILVVVMGLLGGLLYLLSGLDAGQATAMAIALGGLILTLSVALIPLTLVGAFGASALVGVAMLAAVIVAIGGLVAGIGYLMSEFPMLEQFLDSGIPIIEKIGSAIGTFFSGIVSGFAEGSMDSIQKLGQQLSSFADDLQPFIDSVSNVSASGTQGVKNLAEMLLTLTAADILDGLTSWFTGGTSLTDFADQIVPFGEAIAQFGEAVADIDPAAIDAAANAGKVLSEMQSGLVGTGGVVEWFTGQKDLAAFGEQLVVFGESIVSFSEAVSGGINEEAVTAAANAGSVMAEMQSNLVGTGGVVEWFTGQKNMASFGEQLVSFGESIVSFSAAVSGGVSEEAVTDAANAGKIMAEMQSGLIGTGGVVEWFTGEKDMAAFGEQLVSFGESIVSFSETVSGNIDNESMTSAANIGQLMTSVQNAIPKNTAFDGVASLENFGKNMVKFGEQIVEYSSAVSAGIDLDAIRNATLAITSIVAAFKGTSDLSVDGVKSFKKAVQYALDLDIEALTASYGGSEDISLVGNNLIRIARCIKTYSTIAAEIDYEAVSTAANAGNKIVNFVKSLKNIDWDGVSSFDATLQALGSVSLESFINTFRPASDEMSSIGSNLMSSVADGAKAKLPDIEVDLTSAIGVILENIRSKMSEFSNAGTEAAAEFGSGLEDGSEDATSKGEELATEGSNGIRNKYSKFYSAGTYCVTGLVNGLNAGKERVKLAAGRLANAVADGITLTLIIQSPSKLMQSYGEFAGEGFVIGLEKYQSRAYSTAAEVGNSATDGIAKTIRSISDMVEGNLDTQPTIRPVLDLSSVQNGADQINGLFANRSLSLAGVNSNFSGKKLSSMDLAMDKLQKINESGNAELVGAITNLRSDFGSLVNAIGGMQIRMDSGAVVGELVGKMDASLGRIAMHKGRGN